MKLKSLLIGSAAVMAAVSTARAADAIVVEAEPVDYVRVCDMYGTGFFYIPGTETCMNINGYVRTTYASGHYDLEADFDGGPGNTFSVRDESDWHAWNYRGRLNFDVRNETEYGTLRSELRLQGGDTNVQDAPVAIDRALISLAGFRLGYSDTYFTTNHGYGAGTPAINDGFYNYDQAIFFDYTYTMDNFAVTVGVQDSDSGAPNFNGTAGGTADFYAGFNWTSDFGNIAFTAIRDRGFEVTDNIVGTSAVLAASDDWSFKASYIVPLADSGWTFGAWYAWGGNDLNSYVNAYGTQFAAMPALAAGFGQVFPTSIDREWGLQVNGALSDNLTAYAMYSAASGSYSITNAAILDGGLSVDTDATQWAVGVVWTPVTQLSVQVEYSSTTTDADLRTDLGNATEKASASSDGFWVRVTRSF